MDVDGCNRENNLPFRFSPEWLCRNSCIWAMGPWCRVRHCWCQWTEECDVIIYDHLYHAPCLACRAVHELLQSHCDNNREGKLFSWLHIYYAYLASVRFEHSVSWITYDHKYIYTYIYIYIYILYIYIIFIYV